MIAVENASRASLFGALRVAKKRGKDIDPKDTVEVERLAEATAEDYAAIVRETSLRASRSGVSAASKDAKAAIGGAVLGFVLAQSFTDPNSRAIERFAQRREDYTRKAIADAIPKKVALHGDIGTALSTLRSRADTAAISESAMGITHGFMAEAKAIAKSVGASVSWLVLEWVAELDRRTCATCSGMDGVTAPIGGDFDGLLPGFVHGRCRCYFVMRRA